MNRLSDLLFVLSREINRHAGVPEVYWKSARMRGAETNQAD
jgi:cob(I)alamin adenosyltransferase